MEHTEKARKLDQLWDEGNNAARVAASLVIAGSPDAIVYAEISRDRMNEWEALNSTEDRK